MERLTENIAPCNVLCCEREREQCNLRNIGNKCLNAQRYKKLAEYEDMIPKYLEYRDLEKQGLLIKLPCKVGTTVWSIDNVMEEFTPWCLEFDYWMIPMWNKTFFLTQEEAERALEGK